MSTAELVELAISSQRAIQAQIRGATDPKQRQSLIALYDQLSEDLAVYYARAEPEPPGRSTCGSGHEQPAPSGLGSPPQCPPHQPPSGRDPVGHDGPAGSRMVAMEAGKAGAAGVAAAAGGRCGFSCALRGSKRTSESLPKKRLVGLCDGWSGGVPVSS